MIFLKKDNLGWLVILLLSITPVWLWWLAPTTSPRFQGQTNILTSLGQIFALVGISLFSLNFILSARLKILEKYFNGLNKIYDWHAQFGQIAFILLLFHPLLLIPKYAAGSYQIAALFLLPINGLAQNLGWWALVTVFGLIVLTLYLRPKYNIWKLTHKFLGVAFLLGGLHALLIPSDISNYLPLKLYMLILIGSGLAAFSYRTLFGRWLVINRYIYVVSQINQPNNEVIEIIMSAKGSMMNFSPGQFIFVSFKNRQVGREIHPFSLTSPPKNNNIIINVKRLGDYTNRLTNLKVGDLAEIEGPFGVFDYQRGRYKKQIWIAGGIGITPFLSMASSLPLNNDYLVDLYYCTRNQTETIHLSKLENLSSNLNIIPYYSETKGYITAEKIKEISGPLAKKSLYICAPPPMIKSLKKQFRRLGIKKRLMHSEEFNLG